MATISLRVPDRELTLFKDFAQVNNTSLSERIRSTMVERIQDEYDLKIFADYEKQKEGGELETFSHDEVWEEFGL